VIFEVQFPDYVRNVRANGPSALVLWARLQKVAPKDITTDEKRALKILGQRAKEVREVQSERDRQSPAKLRPVLNSYVNGWSGLYEGLSAKARVPAVVSDAGLRAQAINDSLFPDGVSFTQLPAPSAWSEGERRLERLDAEGLESRIIELVGADLLSTVRVSTAALADAIGTGEADRITPSSTGLIEALARFGRAVSRYGRWLAANCDEEDPASVDRFMRAVAPIDAHRAAMGRSSGSDTTTPDTTDTSEPTTAPPPASGSDPVHADRPTTTSNGFVGAPTSNGTPAPSSTTTSNGAPVAA
jgi:hypothetical protein